MRGLIAFVFCALLGGFGSFAACAYSAENGGLTIEDILARQELSGRSPLGVSPDGKWLAVAVEGSHEEPAKERSFFTACGVSGENVGNRIEVVELATGKTFRPFPEPGTSFTPVWSSDSRWLSAYVRDGRQSLCVAFWKAGTDEVIFAHEAPVRPATGWEPSHWLPDSSGVVTSGLREDPQAESSELKIVAVRDNLPDLPGKEAATSAQKYLIGLFRVDAATGKRQLIAPNLQASAWRVSPDGKLVAFCEISAPAPGTQKPNYRVGCVAVSGETPPQTFCDAPASPWGPSLSWSPDGKRIVWHSQGQLGVVTLESATAKLLPPPAKEWPGDAAVAWLPDSSAVLAFAEDALWKVPLDGTPAVKVLALKPKTGWLEGNRNGPVPQVADDGSLWLFSDGKALLVNVLKGEVVREGPAVPGWGRVLAAGHVYAKDGMRVARVDLASGTVDTVFSLPPEPKRTKGEVRKLEWKGLDGKMVKGSLLLPVGYKEGDKVPAILHLYATGDARLSAFVEPEIFATAGYAFFAPAMPMRDGETRMADIQAQTAAATEALIASGTVDPERLALLGQSYGMYTVLSVLVASERYRCAVVSNGPIDLVLMHQGGGEGWTESGQGGMGGTPWQQKERYLANSPYWQFPQVKTPVMLVEGQADGFRAHMLATYLALKRLGVPVEYRSYEGCGHSAIGWPASQQRDLVKAMLRWFDTYLKAPAAPKSPM